MLVQRMHEHDLATPSMRTRRTGLFSKIFLVKMWLSGEDVVIR